LGEKGDGKDNQQGNTLKEAHIQLSVPEGIAMGREKAQKSAPLRRREQRASACCEVSEG
jgi:uncharacterized protein (DUF2345 family)